MHIDERVRARRRELETLAVGLLDECWRGVDTLAHPVRAELALMCGPSGLWRDFYASTPYRALDVPLRVLEDLGVPAGEERDELERTLAEATLLVAAAVLTSELVAFGEVDYTFEHVVLLPSIVALAEHKLALASRHDSEVHRVSLGGWRDHASSLRGHRAARVGRVPPLVDDRADIEASGHRFAPLKAPVACALVCAGRTDLLASVLPLIDEAHALHQLTRELSELARDVARGHCTIPVGRLLGALGLGASDAPPQPSAAFVATLLTPALSELAAEGTRRVAQLEERLVALGLVHASGAMRPLREPFVTLTATYASAAKTTPTPPKSMTDGPKERLPRAVRAAAAALEADPSYREAWEVYRCDLFGEPLLHARVFPVGFALEQRALAGDDVGEEIDSLFARYERNAFHYFEEMSSLCPDSDMLGLMLRLVAHSRSKARWRAALEIPLGWLEKNVHDDGLVPVFFTHDAGDGREYAPSINGGWCSAVQTGLVLGLASFDPDRFHALITTTAGRVFDDIARGSAGCFYYAATTAGGLVLALEAALREHGAFSALEARGRVAAARAAELLLEVARGGGLTAQDAAELSLASAHDAARALRSPTWLELMLRLQRPDGTFDASPLYVVPSREGLTDWYASRTATTAIVYHGLVDAGRRAAR